jgi:TonB-linked SusC/RagA family outer membrane protein
MPGVNVIVKGTSAGTTSDATGKYTLSVGEAESSVLVFSFIGYATQEVDAGTRTTVDVTMAEDIRELSEVVVTALGIERNTKALQYSVTQVSGENFTQARENNIGNALSGRIAGVNVSKVASGPAGSSRIVIRGNKTLTGQNQPLYVIDGIPMDGGTNSKTLMDNNGQAGLWGGNDEGDGLSSLNPDDIESISVLKGANAAALYGSRAGNGVILVTTKKGSSRKGLGIEFNSNYVFETVNDLSELQTQYGAGTYVDPDGSAGPLTAVPVKPLNQAEAYSTAYGENSWGPRLDGSSVVQFDGVSRPYSYAGDNFKRYFNTGTAATNSIAITGGSETQSFRFSVSNLESDGVIPNSGFDRQNASLSVNSKFGKKLTVNAKVMYSREYAKNRPVVSDSPGNGVQAVWRLPANINVDDLRGDPNKPGAIAPGTDPASLLIYQKSVGEEFQQAGNNWGQNPWWAAYQHINDDTRERFITSAQARYDITDWLYVSGRIGMDRFTRRDKTLVPQGVGYQRGGAITEGSDVVREINMEWMLGTNKTFGKFNVNAFVGGNRMTQYSERIAAQGNNFNVPFFAAINNAKDKNYNYRFFESGINSVFGSAEISYNGYLYLTATARNDWFSVLHPDRNSILYPSIGTSFVFSDAINVLPSWLSFGKFRASYAEVGFVSDLRAYDIIRTYSLNANPHLGRPMATFTSAGNNNGSIPNDLLKPATSSEIEFGVDLRFFNNRIGLDATYYFQETTDDILNATVSRASGFGSTRVNIGELQNRGLELMLTGTPVKGDLTWDISVNFAKNKNKVTKLIPGIKELSFEESRTRTTFVKHIEGQPFGMLTGIIQKRSPDGQLVFDEDGQPVRSTAYEILGQTVADWTGGINNSITWKGINLSFLIDIKVGGKIHSGTNVRLDQWGRSERSLTGREGGLTVSGVQEVPENSGNYEPITVDMTPEQARNYWLNLGERASENYTYDAGFGKLRQVTLGYSLPRTLLAKTPFQVVTLSFVARNLAILWKDTPNIDPESSYSANSGAQGLDYFGMPVTRSYGFNLKVGF